MKTVDFYFELKPGRHLDQISWSQLSILKKILLRGSRPFLSEDLKNKLSTLTKNPRKLSVYHTLARKFIFHLLSILEHEKLPSAIIITVKTNYDYKKAKSVLEYTYADFCMLDNAIAKLYNLSTFLANQAIFDRKYSQQRLSSASRAKHGEPAQAGEKARTRATRPDISGARSVREESVSGENCVLIRKDNVSGENCVSVQKNLTRGTISLTATDNPNPQLSFLLNYIFAYPDFRPGQLPAIKKILRGQDSITLLPTGSGKSIIFQLLAFIRPGLALVIAPIISLIDDQVMNLREKGIDKIAGLSSTTQNKSQIISQTMSGEIFMLYLAPERLQIKSFRDQLAEFAKTSAFSVLTIDEAHCVSEWGHDFRPSYLNLAKTLRGFSNTPLLALTGSASKTILTEMCEDLKMPKSSIKMPETFDRPELHYEVVAAKTQDKPKALEQILTDLLPKKFHLPPEEFYKLNSTSTMSGIIFCPHTAGEFGVETVIKQLKSLGLSATKYYGGNSASWNEQKQQNAELFKHNMIPLLVATKSYGMGIDKPNIRYTIHYGLPSSIEEYYQEAGRAGRDRKTAYSFLILSNDHRKRNQKLLDPKITSHQKLLKTMTARALPKPLRQLIKNHELLKLAEDKIKGPDDLDRLLFFHLNNFPGPKTEKNQLLSLVNQMIQAKNQMLNVRNQMLPAKTQMPHIVTIKPNDPTTTEKSLHRLIQLGLIDDYTINFSTMEFTLHGASPKKNTTIDDIDNLLNEIYTSLEPSRRLALAKITEVMTKASKLPSAKDRDHYVRTEIASYLAGKWPLWFANAL